MLPTTQISHDHEKVKEEYFSFLRDKTFPCIAGKAALARQQIQVMVATHMACPVDDEAILSFLYSFIETFRHSKEIYHSAVIIFPTTQINSEEDFELMMWQKLQSLSNLDAQQYQYDPRVSMDPVSAHFSFSLMREAVYIIGLQPKSSRQARCFKYPAMVFNPHSQFEELRHSGKYEQMKAAVRKRDLAISGSVNPMLKDFGEASEVFQYSGRAYDDSWKCPLNIHHGKTEHNSST